MKSFKGYIPKFAASMALALSAASAHAQDSWSGFNVGVYVGAGAGTADTSFTDTQSFRQTITQPAQTTTINGTDNGSGDLSGDVTGAVVELFGGYDHRVGSRYLLGAQVRGTAFSDITLKTIGQRSSTSNTTQTTVAGGVTTTTTSSTTAAETSEITDELSSMIGLVARAGFLPNESVLLYGSGGASLGNFVVPDSDDPFGGERSQWELGYTVGGGAEYRLNEHWSLRAEYGYVHFDVDRSQSNFNSQTTTQGTTTINFNNTFSQDQSTDFSDHTGKVGAVFRF
jgi:outer membrane immunogenic protein